MRYKFGKNCCICGRRWERLSQLHATRVIRFHKFPSRDRARLRKWIKAVRKAVPKFIPKGDPRVCSLHFQPSDYEIANGNRFSSHTDNKFLKKHVVPSLYLFPIDSETVNELQTRRSNVNEDRQCSDNKLEPAIESSNQSEEKSHFQDSSTDISKSRTPVRVKNSAESGNDVSSFNKLQVSSRSVVCEELGDETSTCNALEKDLELSPLSSADAADSNASGENIDLSSQNQKAGNDPEEQPAELQESLNLVDNNSAVSESHEERTDSSEIPENDVVLESRNVQRAEDQNMAEEYFQSQSDVFMVENSCNKKSSDSVCQNQSNENCETRIETTLPVRLPDQSRIKDSILVEISNIPIPRDSNKTVTSPSINTCGHSKCSNDNEILTTQTVDSSRTDETSTTSPFANSPMCSADQNNHNERTETCENVDSRSNTPAMRMEVEDSIISVHPESINTGNSNAPSEKETSSCPVEARISPERIEPSTETSDVTKPGSRSPQASREMRHSEEVLMDTADVTVTDVSMANGDMKTNGESVTEQTEHSSETYKCEFCDKVLDEITEYKKHKKQHQVNRSFPCKQCGQVLSSQSAWEYHMNKHANYRPFLCEFCDKNFITKYAMKQHTKNRHEQKFLKNDSVNMKENEHVNENLKVKDVKVSQFIECEFCDRVFADLESYRVHRKWHKKNSSYSCKLCGEVLAHSLMFDYHMRTHETYKPFTCDNCDKAFTTSNALKEHEKRHKYLCTMCPKKFTSKIRWKEHRKWHKKEKKFGCEVCNKRFRKKENLGIHMYRRHTPKMYTCQYCGNVYPSRNELNAHIERTGENLTICGYCLDTFEDYLEFKRHVMEMHKKEESFVCTECEKTFVTMKLLEDHIQTHIKQAEAS